MADTKPRTTRQTAVFSLAIWSVLAAAIALAAIVNYYSYRSVLENLVRSRLHLTITDQLTPAVQTARTNHQLQAYLSRLRSLDTRIQSIELTGSVPPLENKRAATLSGDVRPSEGILYIALPGASGVMPIATIAVHYSLDPENRLLADKRRTLLKICTALFLILAILTWIAVHIILQPVRTIVQRMTFELGTVLHGNISPTSPSVARWQEENEFRQFLKPATAVLAVLKEAEAYGLTDEPAAGSDR